MINYLMDFCYDKILYTDIDFFVHIHNVIRFNFIYY